MRCAVVRLALDRGLIEGFSASLLDLARVLIPVKESSPEPARIGILLNKAIALDVSCI